MDRIAAMRSFRRVVEARSFSAAARQLGLSAAAVTKHVAWLEADLGARLLHRTTRSVTPSDAGARYVERCARILDDLDEADAEIRGDRDEPRGRIRVNAPVTLGHVYLGALIARFRARHPAVRLDLTVTDQHVNPTAEGADVVIRITRELADTDLVAHRLGAMHRVLCAAPSYLARRGTPRLLDDLARHDVAVYGGTGRPDLLQFDSEAGTIDLRVEPCFTAGNSLLLRDAVVAGIGVALLPSFLVAPDLASRRLRVLLPELRPVEHGIYALHARRAAQSARVRAFVDFLLADLAAGLAGPVGFPRATRRAAGVNRPRPVRGREGTGRSPL